MKAAVFEDALIQELAGLSSGNVKAEGCWIIVNNKSQVRVLKLQWRDCRLMPIIYVHDYEERYNHGADMEELAQEILDHVEEASMREGIPEDFFKNYESVKAGIFCKVINAEKNRILLQEVPHETIEDLAIVYYYELEAVWMEDATILIRNEHLDLWKCSACELKTEAWKNTVKKKPVQFRKLNQVLRDYGMVGAEYIADNPLRLLTNGDGCFGAAVAFYPNVLADCADLVASDLILLPSSIHEWLLIPDREKDPACSLEELRTMVREINRTQVMEKEVLSDEIYYYNRELRRFLKVDEYGTSAK